jgi:hypothetical protein
MGLALPSPFQLTKCKVPFFRLSARKHLVMDTFWNNLPLYDLFPTNLSSCKTSLMPTKPS